MESFEDVFELIISGCDYVTFVENLNDALDALPSTRDSAEAVLNAVDAYDILELYNALFDKFKDFLTDREKEKIIAKYKKISDLIFLPWWVKEEYLNEKGIKGRIKELVRGKAFSEAKVTHRSDYSRTRHHIKVPHTILRITMSN